MKKYAFYIVGLFSGFINGILGTGGGTVVVPCIEWLGMDTKKSHSTAIAIILPITIVSAFFISSKVMWISNQQLYFQYQDVQVQFSGLNS